FDADTHLRIRAEDRKLGIELRRLFALELRTIEVEEDHSLKRLASARNSGERITIVTRRRRRSLSRSGRRRLSPRGRRFLTRRRRCDGSRSSLAVASEEAQSDANLDVRRARRRLVHTDDRRKSERRRCRILDVFDETVETERDRVSEHEAETTTRAQRKII